MNDIIQEIRNGNKAAVKAVYQKYAKDVYNFAKSITGDHDSALFATKKTFSILFNNIKRGDEPANLRTAALKIAYDEAYNAATALKDLDNSNDAYAESESPANKTYLQPKNIENNSYNDSSSYDSDDYDDAYSARSSRPTAKRQQRFSEPEYDDYGYEQDNYDNYDEYDEYEAPKKSKRGKNKVDVYNAFDDEDQYDDYDEPIHEKQGRNKGLFIFCIIINVILILILLWFLCGLLVNLGVLPNFDLGYTWFNNTIYPLF